MPWSNSSSSLPEKHLLSNSKYALSLLVFNLCNLTFLQAGGNQQNWVWPTPRKAYTLRPNWQGSIGLQQTLFLWLRKERNPRWNCMEHCHLWVNCILPNTKKLIDFVWPQLRLLFQMKLPHQPPWYLEFQLVLCLLGLISDSTWTLPVTLAQMTIRKMMNLARKTRRERALRYIFINYGDIC